MGQPHPTLTLILDIDKRLYSPNMQQEIQRDYAYVGSTLVRTHEPAREDAPIENTMYLVLKLGRRQYLYSKDEGADELWNGFLEHWFYNAFHKLGNHMKIYNRRQREIGMPELVFDWLELELQNGKLRLRMHTDSNSDILPTTNTWLTTIRTALNEGRLGNDIEQIVMPAPEQYALQLEQGIVEHEKRMAQKEEERLAEEKRIQEEKERAEAAAEAAFLESPQLVEQAHAEEDAAQADIAENSADAANDEQPHVTDFDHEAYNENVDYSFDEPLFALDYSVWRVEYLDGSARVFDSKTNEFIG